MPHAWFSAQLFGGPLVEGLRRELEATMRTLATGILAVLVVPATFAQDTKTEDKVSGSSLIDKWIRAKWSDAQLKPAGRTTDAEYMRRVYLDIVGQIPSLEEAEAFLTEKGP